MRSFAVGLFLVVAIFTVNSAGAFEYPGPLVSANWLKANLSNENTIVLDIRSPRKSRDFYIEGHIEGAVSAPYNSGWREKVDGVIGMLPPMRRLSAHIGKLGIGNETHVIIVPFGKSSTDFSAATRIYWTFKVVGHDRVSILDGGYAAWLNNGGGLSQVEEKPIQKTFDVHFRPHLVSSETEVLSSLGHSVSLIDARPTAQYLGKAKSPVVTRAGTIPGSLSLKQSTFYNTKQSSFLATRDLATVLTQSGIDKSEKAITFCNTGHWASIVWFALSEISGRKNVSLYDGSMAEWTLREENPVR